MVVYVSNRMAQLDCVETATLHEQPMTVQPELSSFAETVKGISEHSDVHMAIAFVVYC